MESTLKCRLRKPDFVYETDDDLPSTIFGSFSYFLPSKSKFFLLICAILLIATSLYFLPQNQPLSETNQQEQQEKTSDLLSSSKHGDTTLVNNKKKKKKKESKDGGSQDEDESNQVDHAEVVSSKPTVSENNQNELHQRRVNVTSTVNRSEKEEKINVKSRNQRSQIDNQQISNEINTTENQIENLVGQILTSIRPSDYNNESNLINQNVEEISKPETADNIEDIEISSSLQTNNIENKSGKRDLVIPIITDLTLQDSDEIGNKAENTETTEENVDINLNNDENSLIDAAISSISNSLMKSGEITRNIVESIEDNAISHKKDENDIIDAVISTITDSTIMDNNKQNNSDVKLENEFADNSESSSLNETIHDNNLGLEKDDKDIINAVISTINDIEKLNNNQPSDEVNEILLNSKQSADLNESSNQQTDTIDVILSVFNSLTQDSMETSKPNEDNNQNLEELSSSENLTVANYDINGDVINSENTTVSSPSLDSIKAFHKASPEPEDVNLNQSTSREYDIINANNNEASEINKQVSDVVTYLDTLKSEIDDTKNIELQSFNSNNEENKSLDLSLITSSQLNKSEFVELNAAKDDEIEQPFNLSSNACSITELVDSEPPSNRDSLVQSEVSIQYGKPELNQINIGTNQLSIENFISDDFMSSQTESLCADEDNKAFDSDGSITADRTYNQFELLDDSSDGSNTDKLKGQYDILEDNDLTGIRSNKHSDNEFEFIENQQQKQQQQQQHKETEETQSKIETSNNDINLNNEKKNLTKDDSKSLTSLISQSSVNSLLGLYNVKHLHAIADNFRNLNEISNAVREAGLEKSQLIFGIDFTISNLENGLHTFNGRSLHYHDADIKNPYQKVIEILGKTLESFDLDGRIPAYGFGDSKTKDRKVFPFSPTGNCNGFKDVLKCYNSIVENIELSGPTNFAPLIKEAIKIVKITKQYHILVIVADGQVTNERQTREAIVEASNYPLSIVMVGVGDGPWDLMNIFDDSLPKRNFDNFQFVNYHEVTTGVENPDEQFALHALMEIPDQYKAIKELGLLDFK